ncbi:TonB-dependent receptor plug domain-containing protein [Cupriavidus basilensis]
MARGGRLGLLGNKGVMDTPFAVTNYTAQRIDGISRPSRWPRVLNSDPSVRFTGQVGGVTDSFFIRGFLPTYRTTDQEGQPVRDQAAGWRLWRFHRTFATACSPSTRAVEVLEGRQRLAVRGMSPNGGVGGVVNVVPKRALAQDLTRFTLDYRLRCAGGRRGRPEPPLRQRAGGWASDSTGPCTAGVTGRARQPEVARRSGGGVVPGLSRRSPACRRST